MSTSPRLLDQLAGLTAIRDLELLEFSLLKTLNGFLRPRALTLIRLDSKGRPSMEITYGDHKCTVLRDDLCLSDNMRAADDYLCASGAPETVFQQDGGVMIVQALLTTRTHRSYLQISKDKELSRLDAHMVAGVLQIYRNFCALLQHAQTDQLTNLANRKTFDESVARVHELIPVAGEPIPNDRRGSPEMNFWLVMVDIDHFKSINDRFGHLFGDEVLVLLARMMQSSFREDDLVFRFGGEEFVLILRCADIDMCRSVLDRFRNGVAQYPFPQVGTVTVSMGAIQMKRDIFTPTLLDYADQALYYSKHHGRNQTTFFEDMLTQGLVKAEEFTPGDISFF